MRTLLLVAICVIGVSFGLMLYWSYNPDSPKFAEAVAGRNAVPDSYIKLSRSINLKDMAIGGKACTTMGYTVSAEGRVWLSGYGLNGPCGLFNTDEWVEIERRSDGYHVTLQGKVERSEYTDSWFQDLGSYIPAITVSVK